MKTIAIFVPGICGSQLRVATTGHLVWPGTLLDYFGPYKDFDKLMDDGLVASDVIRSFGVIPQYRSLISDMEVFGFKESFGTLRLCPYDWRLSNELSAAVLAHMVDDAAAAGDCHILLIGHSMGGLICRFYLESGTFAQRPGFNSVRQFIALGTPHLGSPIALAAAVGQHKELFLSKTQVQMLANDPRYPSLYQLLPPPGTPFLWNSAAGKRMAILDHFSPAVAGELGLVEENLRSAVTFHQFLSLRRRPDRVDYFFFAGNSLVTPTHASTVPSKSAQTLRVDAADHGGDGTVPTWSALLAGVQGQFVNGEHGTIYRSRELRITLAALCGKPGLLMGHDEGDIELCVRDRVALPNQQIHLSLGSRRPLWQLSGELQINLVEDPSAPIVDTAERRTVRRIPLSYKGASLDQLSIAFPGPPVPGAYAVDFITSGGPQCRRRTFL